MPTKAFFRSFVLGILTFVAIASCSQPQTQTLPNSTSQFKVGMILSGSHLDNSWSQAGYEGIKLIEKQYNAQVEYKENVNETESENVIREFAKAGFNLIIAHSGGYIKSAEIVADEFPQTKFALVTTYAGNNRNLGAVAFRSGEVGYLTGLLAALKTKTNKVAYIVGDDYPVYQEEAALFVRGAKATNPAVEVYTKFLESWTDQEAATEAALELVEAGADIFAINADEAGIAAIKTITQKPGIYVIGWTKDLSDLAPDRVLTSVLQDIPGLVMKAAELAQRGRWEGKLYKFGLKEKVYDFAPFRGLLTPEQEKTFNQAKEQVMSGKIDVSPVSSK